MYLPAAPAQSVSNIIAIADSSTSVNLTWSPPPPTFWNGPITSYIIGKHCMHRIAGKFDNFSDGRQNLKSPIFSLQCSILHIIICNRVQLPPSPLYGILFILYNLPLFQITLQSTTVANRLLSTTPQMVAAL